MRTRRLRSRQPIPAVLAEDPVRLVNSLTGGTNDLAARRGCRSLPALGLAPRDNVRGGHLLGEWRLHPRAQQVFRTLERRRAHTAFGSGLPVFSATIRASFHRFQRLECKCSFKMHRSTTTCSPAACALAAACRSITPSCIQTARAPMRMASST